MAGNSPAGSRVAGLSEDELHHDPLLDCLVELTRLHARPSTRAALTAGLPLEKGNLTPSLFARAAARAGLSGRVVRRDLDGIDDALLPAILLLQGDEACILLGWNEARDSAKLLFPETGQGEVSLSRNELAGRYLGIAIFSRPRFLFDARTPEVGKVAKRHWFWGVLMEQAALYRDVLGAALLINVFAVVMPVFTMNVYDRVVPNNATDTLWVLALGVLLVFAMDFMMRLLRGHFIDLASARVDVKLSGTIMERVLGMQLISKPASVGSFASNLRAFESVRDFIASASLTTLVDLPFVLLFLLDAATDGLAPNVLAEKAGVTRATITGLLNGLERDQLIERHADPLDGRAMRIALTPEGKQLIGSVFAQHGRWIAGLFSHLSAQERIQLSELLAKVAAGTLAGKCLS